MRVVLSVLILLFSTLQPATSAQKRFSNLDQVVEAIERRIKDKMPDWNNESVHPASVDENVSSDKVIIQQWTLGNKSARVAVLQHQSEEEAISVLRQFAADKRTDNRLHGLGDEAYLWGIRNSIAFRQGNLTIYMSAVVMEKPDAEEALRNPAAAGRKAAQAEHDEEGRVTRSFAHYVAAALANL
ncbi:MAG TPA: hypothetical protein VF656_00395 [Pyrinomonadaceae bacterium]